MPERKITAIIQARMGSERLPGKILKNLCGIPMLLHIVNRLRHSNYINNIVVATTTLEADKEVEKFCNEYSVNCFSGSSENVLSRFYFALQKYSSDIVIRITADCPLIDHVIVDKMLNVYLESENVDYLSNTLRRTFPRGLDTEIFSSKVLENVFNSADSDFEKEHVTPFIYNNPEKFNLMNYENNIDLSMHRWTVDTPEDFQLIENIYSELYREDAIFLLEDVLDLFKRRPELIKINQHIQQKAH